MPYRLAKHVTVFLNYGDISIASFSKIKCSHLQILARYFTMDMV